MCLRYVFLWIFHTIFSSYQEVNTEKILYGLDDIKQARVVIIVCSKFATWHFPDFIFCCQSIWASVKKNTSLLSILILQVEGEIDKLSMEEAGYLNCVSVPDGAPPQVSNKLPDKDHVRTLSWYCCMFLLLASIVRADL
jgi:twinkle protein